MRSTLHRNKLRRSRGQSLVELALVTPVLLILIVLSIDAGRVMIAYQTIGNMARSGADYASLNPSDTSGISDAALEAAGGSIFGVAPTVTSVEENDSFYVPNTTTPYKKVVVTVTYEYHPIFSLPPMPSSLTIRRQVEMRVNGS